jgi:hypothetical protein
MDAASYDVVSNGVVKQVGNESLNEIRVAFEERRGNCGIDIDSQAIHLGTVGAKDR